MMTVYLLTRLWPLFVIHQDGSADDGISTFHLVCSMFLYVTRLVLLAFCTQIGTLLQLDPIKLPKADRAYEDIIREFGTDILVKQTKDDGTTTTTPPPIDRRKLGEIIFADNTKRRKLNSMTHPRITKIMLKRIILQGFAAGTGNVVLADVPLIYEAGWTMRALFGTIIVVATTPTIQLDRLIKRNDDLTRKQCEERIASQMDITKKVKLADFVIWNNGGMEDLKKEVERTRRNVLDRCRFVVGGGRINYSVLIRMIGGFYVAVCVFGLGHQQ